ncbi:hypothetical protein PGTUg99_001959 [Puccinia graminis f. sp. tritici]|uniref:Uncharacterized protein n=1 Tax=Puccinia graminis f. sp. tritici TaxID=56615 RepID=A0A5B0QG32_PUCGR|nr:hypothetical protein PGTUg99_001959 [Puccinia graminis f. sp. tritici]
MSTILSTACSSIDASAELLSKMSIDFNLASWPAGVINGPDGLDAAELTLINAFGSACCVDTCGSTC